MSVASEILDHMTTTQPLADPYGPSNGFPRTLTDPYDAPNPFGRPPRVEDQIERHPNPQDGRPRVWLPDNSGQWYYSRPSSWGKKGEDTKNLSAWTTRKTVEGFLEHDPASKTLRLEWSGTDPADRERRNKMCEQAKGLADDSARVGSALHALTERHDLGLATHPPEEYAADLEAWKQATRHFEIVTMPSGRPAVEVFVALDYDHPQRKYPIRLAGTFDRLWRYKPCPICGCRNYIGDLKSGKVEFGKQTIAVQEGVYANGQEYIPLADGTGAVRHPLPDVCRHRGIVLNLPAGSGQAEVIWVDVARGYNWAVNLIPEIVAYRNSKNVMTPFVPSPDVWAELERAETPDRVRELWVLYPGPHWTENNNALTKAAGERIVALGGTPKTT
jgi:hypothetical protein